MLFSFFRVVIVVLLSSALERRGRLFAKGLLRVGQFLEDLVVVEGLEVCRTLKDHISGV